jgi:hypothetical protein
MARNFYGILSTLCSAAAFRSYLAKRLGTEFDRRYGTDTYASLPLSAMDGVDMGLLHHAVQYEVSAIPKFQRAMAALVGAGMNDPGQYDFVDFGSGKGLVVMLAAQRAFKKVYGVEMAPVLHEVALENVRIFQEKGGDRSPIALSCGNALTYPWPDGNVIAYLYNPFDEELTAKFIDRLLEEAARMRRKVAVVYVNPVHQVLFERNGGLRLTYSDGTLCVYEYVGGITECSQEAN